MLKRTITGLMVCLVLGQISLADVVFSDGFERVVGDTGPDLATGSGDHDPDWGFVTENLSPRQVVVYAAGATDSSAPGTIITPPEGRQAVRLRAGGTAIAQGFRQVTQATVSLWHLEPAANAGTGKMLTIELRHGPTAAVTLGFDKDAASNWGLGYYDADGVFHKIADARTDAWTRIVIFADADKNRFLVRYGDNVYDHGGQGYPFRHAVDGIAVLRLGQSAAPGSTLNSYVDDVRVHDTNRIAEPDA